MEQTKSKSSKKLKIAVIVLAVALVVAVGAIFGVYAATQQNVSTNFSVRYSVGDNVAIKATTYIYDHDTFVGDGNYSYANVNESIQELYSVQYNVNNTSVIKSADGTVLNSIPSQTATLTAEQKYVTFVYEIENLGENSIVIELDWSDYFDFLESGATDNIYNCKFSFIDGDLVGANGNLPVEDFIYDYGYGWGEDCMYPGFALSADYSYTLAGGEKYYIAVAIGVNDVNKSALCESDNNTGLMFTVTDADIYGQ